MEGVLSRAEVAAAPDGARCRDSRLTAVEVDIAVGPPRRRETQVLS
jgi:hypothetical protein